MRLAKLTSIIFVCAFYFILGIQTTFADHFENREFRGDSRGPGNNVLILKKSSDGEFHDRGEVVIKGGHVPNLVMSDDTIFLYFQWFPKSIHKRRWFDHIGVIVSNNLGETWSKPRGIVLSDIPNELLGPQGRPMDPAAVSLTGGAIRLFFTLEPRQPHNRVIGDAKIYSAISNDGVNFNFEQGVRFEIKDVELRDPAIAYFDKKWHLYCPNQKRNGTGFHSISSDGLNFKRVENVNINGPGDWLGSATTTKDSIYFYGTVWMGTSNDGIEWDRGRSIGLGPDPAILHVHEGLWLGVGFRPIR